VTEDLQKRIQAALANPQNLGEMAGADSIGTVGNTDRQPAVTLHSRNLFGDCVNVST
jgi:hypothetical protein